MKKTILLAMSLCASGPTFCPSLLAAPEARPTAVTATKPAGPAANRRMNAGEIPEVAGLKPHQVYENQYGYIVCDTAEEADAMFEAMKKATGLFCGYFDRDPGKGIYIKTFDGCVKVAGKLRETWDGSWILPHLTDGTIQEKIDEDQVKEAIRKQIKAQVPGMSDKEIDEVVRQNMGQVLKQLQSKGQEINLHELGHILFAGAYWKQIFQDPEKSAKKPAYGTPAPDWLDETPAVLLEVGTIGKDRMNTMAELAKKNSPDLPSLEQMFAKVRETEPEAGKTKDGVKVEVEAIRTDDGEDRDTIFYAQCHAFAQFMIETTGKKTIFGSIAESDVKGVKFDGWLKDNAARYQLPPTVAELDQAFRNWLKAGGNR